MKTSIANISAALVIVCLMGCGQKNKTGTPSDLTRASTPQNNSTTAALSQALTFYASFEQPKADFGPGDLELFSGGFKGKGAPDGEPLKGLGNPPLLISAGAGKFGKALEFTKQNTHPVFYKMDGNVSYREVDFNGTCSFWLNVGTEEIPGQYCDPIQLTDKYYASDCIWIDITKNDVPPDLRLGVFGDQEVWDVKKMAAGASEEFFWRLAKVSAPPLAKGTWTHVVITWEDLNTDRIGRAKLYLNGELAGISGPIREPFKWDISKTTLRLGTGDYVGSMDDLALFNRALNQDEIRQVYKLKTGVQELLPK
jgi:Concanavalin A-like lectin/glucanases superfamily